MGNYFTKAGRIPKAVLLLLLVVVSTFLVAGFHSGTAAADSNLGPTGLPGAEFIVKLTGTTTPTQYTVKADRQANTGSTSEDHLTFQFAQGGVIPSQPATFGSALFAWGGDNTICINNSGNPSNTAKAFTWTFTVTLNGATAGSKTVNYCGQGGVSGINAYELVNVPVTTPTAAASVSGTLGYTAPDGTNQPFRSNSVVVLTNTQNGNKKPLTLGDDGTFSATGLLPGSYTISGTYAPTAFQHGEIQGGPAYTLASTPVTLTAGNNTTLNLIVGADGKVTTGTLTAADTSDTAGTAPQINCSVQFFNPLSWFLCPLATALETVVSGLDNEINNFMDITPGKGSYPSACTAGDQWCNYYKPWSVIRDISLGLIVVFALIAIVSQALGFEIFDAYTLRKVLPRLLIAIIGITLSWPLMMFFINLTDALGLGVRGLIYAPFNGPGFKVALGGGGQFFTSLIAGGAILALGFAGLLSFVATAALAVAIAFLVLVLRQMLIVMLVIFAPIAIVCYILPNTQKTWKLWWDSFSKGLLMFPIIAAFIAIGRVFAAVNSQGAGSINQIISFTAYFAPYFLIPFTFRLAGGAISTIGGLVNDRGRGAFDRLKKYRGGKIAQNMHDMKTGNRFKSDNVAARAFNRTSETLGAIPNAGYNPRRMRSRMQAAMSRHGMDEAAEYSEKNSAFGVIKSNDDFLQAGIAGKGKDSAVRSHLQGLKNKDGSRVYSDAAVEQAVSAIREARRDVSSEVFDTAATMALPATGTAFKTKFDDDGNIIGGGAGEMHEAINHVAGNDRVKAARMLAAMRGGASSARRFDLSGGSFGAELGTMEAQYNGGEAGGMSTADATRTTIKQSLNGQGGSYVAGARTGAVEGFAPVMLDELKTKYQKASQSGNLEDMADFRREVAKVAGRYDAMSSIAPDSAEVLAKQVMSQSVGDHTVLEWMDAGLNDPNQRAMRKDYGVSARAGASAGEMEAQRAAIQASMANVQPPPIPPVQPPPGR